MKNQLLILVDFAKGPLSTVSTTPPSTLRRHAAILRQAADLLAIPVALARPDIPGDEGGLIDELKTRPSGLLIEHTESNLWNTPALQEWLQKNPVQSIILAGIATDVGVALPALSAKRTGYAVQVLIDACATISPLAQQAAWMRLSAAGVALNSFSSWIAECQGDYTQGVGPALRKLLGLSFEPSHSPAPGDRHEQGLAKLNSIAGHASSKPLSDWSSVAPDMTRYIVDFIAGDILSRPGLDPKSRQLATVAMLAATNHAPDEFKMHLRGALHLGWTQVELTEVLIQTAVFAGFPAALNALTWAKEIFQGDPS